MMSKGKILVIDDSEVLLARIKAALTAVGYEVIATSQTVGLGRHLKACDLTIVDFHMPGFDGGNVVASLQSALSERESRPLFYLYTSDEGVGSTYRQLGFDGLFTRKGDDAALVAQVNAVFRMLQLQRLAKRER